ncbi:MAG: hypothetical protein Q3959_03045 [Limosilactobacillus sp.]|uniref:hypothetical protein n=1 Tax=Limosilactobacillus sp. TaxID=2773925 RepID=UPI002706B741|nr:hypothetical protein [Limosilactobacillus sp.]
MITVFVQNNDKTQTVRCSDGSQGVMQFDKDSSAPFYKFQFYAHRHPSFWVSSRQFTDGKKVVVKDVDHEENFTLKFV